MYVPSKFAKPHIGDGADKSRFEHALNKDTSTLNYKKEPMEADDGKQIVKFHHILLRKKGMISASKQVK